MAQQPPLLCGQRGIAPPHPVCSRRATHVRRDGRGLVIDFLCEWCARVDDRPIVTALEILMVDVSGVAMFAGVSQEPSAACREAEDRFRQALASAGAVVPAPLTRTRKVRYYPARAPLVTPYGD